MTWKKLDFSGQRKDWWSRIFSGSQFTFSSHSFQLLFEMLMCIAAAMVDRYGQFYKESFTGQNILWSPFLKISSLAKCTDFDTAPLMYLQCYLMTMFGHFVFLLASIFHLAWSVITVIRIRLWSHWDSFYATEYCDSQLFLPSASHVEEARFNIINLIILVLVSLRVKR